MTDYVQNVSEWEDWQPAYRFGVLLIYPPEPLRSLVNNLRAKHDPKSQAICDAHISLTVPLPEPISQTDWGDLQALAGSIPSVALTYGPLRHYLPHPGVALGVEPQEQLDQLRKRLESSSAFVGATARSYPFSGHMTIAEFITAERTRALMEELKDAVPPGAFLCDRVSLAVPDEGFRFEERDKLWLAH